MHECVRSDISVRMVRLGRRASLRIANARVVAASKRTGLRQAASKSLRQCPNTRHRLSNCMAMSCAVLSWQPFAGVVKNRESRKHVYASRLMQITPQLGRLASVDLSYLRYITG